MGGAVDGTRTRDLRRDGRCCLCLSYEGMVRALGLEPSLTRGKGPVPYRLGVTRKVGRKGIEPPVSEDGWSTASCAPWRDRPNGGQVALAPTNDAYAVVKVLLSGPKARRARPEGVEPPACGFGGRGATMARAQGINLRARRPLCAPRVRAGWNPEALCRATGSRRRACRYWRASVVPTIADDSAVGCLGTRPRRSSTRPSPGALCRRRVCVS